MEIIDLLSGFDLDHLKDKDLRSLSRGLAVTFVRRPLQKHTGSVPGADEMKESSVQEFIRYLKKAILGNVFDKAAMVASVTKNIVSSKSMPDPQEVPLDPSGIVEIGSSMHFHHMSEEDFRTLASSAADLLLDGGPLYMLEEHGMKLDDSTLKTVTATAADRIYTGLKMALAEKDALLEAADDSKKRHIND